MPEYPNGGIGYPDSSVSVGTRGIARSKSHNDLLAIGRRRKKLPAQQITIGADGPVLSGTPVTGQSNWYKPGNTEISTGTTEEVGGNKFLTKVLPKIISGAEKLAPFVSNMRNALTKPPMPQRGIPYQYTALQTVNLNDEKNKVSEIYEAGNRSAERNVDGNTAEAIKAFNRGEEISKLSAVNEREQNINTQIQNTQAQMDASVSAANVGLENDYREKLLERDIAHKTAQSENLANAMDKFVAIGNEKNKQKTELDKANVLKGLYERSGVLRRQGKMWKEQKIEDPFGLGYKWLEEENLAAGGLLAGLTSLKIPMRKILN